MERVKVVAKTGFVSQLVGSVNRKQVLTVTKDLAEHFIKLGLVSYEKKSETTEVETTEVETSQPQDSTTVDGAEEQSASLPVETALPTTTSQTSRRGRRGRQS